VLERFEPQAHVPSFLHVPLHQTTTSAADTLSTTHWQAIQLFEQWERRCNLKHPGRRPFHRYRPPTGESPPAAAAAAGEADAAVAISSGGGGGGGTKKVKVDVFKDCTDVVRAWVSRDLGLAGWVRMCGDA